MEEIIPTKTPAKRRRFSKAFKTRILEACHQPGASVAGVALANGLNANLVHRWRHLAKDQATVSPAPADFMPIALSNHAPYASGEVVITLEVGSIKVHWPIAHIEQSIAWLRALQS
jgi:transposase